MTPTMSRPFSRARARSWMSRIANCARPAEQELDAVGRGRRRRDAQVDALGAVEVALAAPGRSRRATALGWKSSTSLADWFGRSSEPREQPATASAAASASAARSAGAGHRRAQHGSRRREPAQPRL